MSVSTVVFLSRSHCLSWSSLIVLSLYFLSWPSNSCSYVLSVVPVKVTLVSRSVLTARCCHRYYLFSRHHGSRNGTRRLNRCWQKGDTWAKGHFHGPVAWLPARVLPWAQLKLLRYYTIFSSGLIFLWLSRQRNEERTVFGKGSREKTLLLCGAYNKPVTETAVQNVSKQSGIF